MKHLSFSILLFLTVFATSSNAFHKRNYCSGLKQCLMVDGRGCHEKDQIPIKDVEYDDAFCAYHAKTVDREINPRSAIGKKIFSDLGRKYRVSYPANGILPVNAEMMDFLLEHIPLAAHLVNAYQGTKYEGKYKNKSHSMFWGTNGGHLQGTFQWASRQDQGRKNVIYGKGSAQVLMWKMYGVAVVYLDYAPSDSGSISYTLDCIAFPGNTIINGIMNLGVFKKVVRSKMDEIIGDVTNAALAFAEGNTAPIVAYKPLRTPANKKILREFEKVIQSSGWKKSVLSTPSKK